MLSQVNQIWLDLSSRPVPILGRIAIDNEYQDITLEIDALTVQDEPDIKALLRSPEAETAASLLRLGGALVFLAGVIFWVFAH